MSNTVVRILATVSAVATAFNYVYNESPFAFFARKIAWASGSSLAVLLIRSYFLVPFMLLPSILLSQVRKEEINGMRQQYLRKYGDRLENIKISPTLGVQLDSIVWRNPEQEVTPPASQRWLIFFNPNGLQYEEAVDFLVKYAKRVGANFLAFNYRGVGRSEGPGPKTEQDLFDDGIAAMKYLLDMGVQSKNVLIHGHSLGGGVGVIVRALYPDGPIINDRSFVSLVSVAKALLSENQGMRTFVSMALGAFGGFSVSGILDLSTYQIFMGSLASATALGGFAHFFPKSFAHFAVVLLKQVGWDMDVSSHWKLIKGHKVVVYHHLDGIISHQHASLFSHLQTSMGSVNKVLQLKLLALEGDQPHMVYHCYGLDTDADEWEELVSAALSAFSE